jgi:hypothetical protein
MPNKYYRLKITPCLHRSPGDRITSFHIGEYEGIEVAERVRKDLMTSDDVIVDIETMIRKIGKEF